MTKHVTVELNMLELDIIHKALELIRKEKFIDSLLDDRYIMMISEDFRNASNNKLMESTLLSGRISWSKKDVGTLQEIIGKTNHPYGLLIDESITQESKSDSQ